jgi:hypothetical protein
VKVTTKNNVHSYVCSDFNSTTTWRKKIEKKNGNIQKLESNKGNGTEKIK